MMGGIGKYVGRTLAYLCLLFCFAPAPLLAQELLAN